MSAKKILICGIAAAVSVVVINYCLMLFSGPSKDKMAEAAEYCMKNGYSTDIVCFCNFSRHTGTHRFWIYDLNKDKVIARSLCPHGSGKGSTKRNAVFSNEPGCNCSSLGKYRVITATKTTKGMRCLTLKGLDKTNSNAISRSILIHGNTFATYFRWGIWPLYHPLSPAISQGCFAINGHVLTTLIAEVKSSTKPILLYAYN